MLCAGLTLALVTLCARLSCSVCMRVCVLAGGSFARCVCVRFAIFSVASFARPNRVGEGKEGSRVRGDS